MKSKDKKSKFNHDAADGSDGQNPIWPGEGLRKPGTKFRDKPEEGGTEETTIIPVVR